MFRELKKRTKNEKGLTLIELLAVIVILAIISAISVPAIGNIINNSRDKAILSDALSVIAGGKLAHLQLKCGEVGCGKADLEKYVEGVELPSGTTVKLETTGWTITGFDYFTGIKDQTKYNAHGGSENAIKKALN